MKIVGLTGSIAMGKSTVADFFKQAGISVFSADDAVHQLYKDEPVVSLIARAFPSVIEDNKINRLKLSKILLNNHDKLQKLEKIIHPLVQEKEKEFIERAHREEKKLVILEIPLLFETKSEKRVDSVIVVSAPRTIQKERAMIRQNMNEEKFAFINARQMPDKEKRERADFIIDTGKNLENTREQVYYVIKKLLKN
ncbi:dephospho-CoA kinase [Bartonella birtlesii]|uniref:Dephospho-CoA kinase n=1 Tax=Bartonella birtlesii LL-WM9 TaxID=1094552 RepID=J0YP86_9HYPH|nr:dephospho-CoA kinase [Bartonella birtlesii]EJF76503.1 dephospho-CoA kinase [Bartonella birtlesii LL-WM9]